MGRPFAAICFHSPLSPVLYAGFSAWKV